MAAGKAGGALKDEGWAVSRVGRGVRGAREVGANCLHLLTADTIIL